MTGRINFKLSVTCAAVLFATGVNAQSIDDICEQIANLDPFIVDDAVERMCQPAILSSSGNVRMSSDGSLVIDFGGSTQDGSGTPVDVAAGSSADSGTDLTVDVVGVTADLSIWAEQGVTVVSGLSGDGTSEIIQAAVATTGAETSGNSLVDADILGRSGDDSGSDLIDLNVFSSNEDNGNDVVDIDVASTTDGETGSVASVDVADVATVDVGGSSAISVDIAGISVSLGN